MNRRAAHVTEDRLEVDYQGGKEPNLTMVKTVMDMEQEDEDKSKQSYCEKEEKDD